jgi:hypothetical protein
VFPKTHSWPGGASASASAWGGSAAGGGSGCESPLTAARSASSVPTNSLFQDGAICSSVNPSFGHKCTTHVTCAYVSIRQHASGIHQQAYVSTRQKVHDKYRLSTAPTLISMRQAYVSIRQHMQHASGIRQHTSGIRQHTSAYAACVRHTSAYVRNITSAPSPPSAARTFHVTEQSTYLALSATAFSVSICTSVPVKQVK